MENKKISAPAGAPTNYTNKNNTLSATGQRVHDTLRKARQEFIEIKLRDILKVKSDFEDIKYGRNSLTEKEYMRVKDIFGGHITIEITNLELSQILDYVSWIVVNGYITDDKGVACPDSGGIVTDRYELRKLAPIFK